MRYKLVGMMMNSDKSDKIGFVRARWWQGVAFLRLNFALVRGTDPLADHILANPRSFNSIMTYFSMLGTYFFSDPYFITFGRERAGLLWLYAREKYVIWLSLGVLPAFRGRGLGKRAIAFIDEYASERGLDTILAWVAAGNAPSHGLLSGRGYRRLGMETTLLTLDSPALPDPLSDLELHPLTKPEAREAWNRWQQRSVAHAAGQEMAQITADAVRPLEAGGDSFALYRGGEEIGFAYLDGEKAGLFLLPALWLETAGALAALASRNGAPIRQLTLLQPHADALEDPPPFAFTRALDSERCILFKRI
jgi:GNAT superfamily N-acetyltransferase